MLCHFRQEKAPETTRDLFSRLPSNIVSTRSIAGRIIIEAEAEEESLGHQQRGKASTKAIVVSTSNEPKLPKTFSQRPSQIGRSRRVLVLIGLLGLLPARAL